MKQPTVSFLQLPILASIHRSFYYCTNPPAPQSIHTPIHSPFYQIIRHFLQSFYSQTASSCTISTVCPQSVHHTILMTVLARVQVDLIFRVFESPGSWLEFSMHPENSATGKQIKIFRGFPLSYNKLLVDTQASSCS